MMINLDQLDLLYAAGTQGKWLPATGDTPLWVMLEGDEFGRGWKANKENDRQLVSALHNAYPALSARIRELEGQVSTLQARVDAGDRLRDTIVERMRDPTALFHYLQVAIGNYDAFKTAASSEVEK